MEIEADNNTNHHRITPKNLQDLRKENGKQEILEIIEALRSTKLPRYARIYKKFMRRFVLS